MEVNTPIIKVQSSQTINAVSPDQEYAALHEQFEAYKRRTELEKLEADLEKQMAIINTHKAELDRLEEDFRNNANEASVPLQSYECGFLRGIATIAMATPGRSTAMTHSAVVPPISQQRVTA